MLYCRLNKGSEYPRRALLKFLLIDSLRIPTVTEVRTQKTRSENFYYIALLSSMKCRYSL